MKLFIIAGEPSGDLHGKNLLQEMQARHGDLELMGIGGDGLASLGVKLVRHIRETNFMGFVQVVRNLKTIRGIFKDVKKALLEFQPEAIILIDYPGFNLRIAKFCKEHGIKVLYYISPQVWAWKKSRVKKIQRDVDRMFVILPFEKEFYRKEGVEVDFVGHPLLDEIAEGHYRGKEIRKELLGEKEQLIALLPGSRKQEISRMLPKMLEVQSDFPKARFVIAGAPSQEPAFYQELLGDESVPVLHAQTYDLLDAADYALVTSGTATLETALFEVPEVVCYAGSPLSVWLARRLIKVKFISLVNLIMDRELVRELIQQELNRENLRAELKKLMDPEHQVQLQSDYQALKAKLGNAGASARTAEGILAFLGISNSNSTLS